MATHEDMKQKIKAIAQKHNLALVALFGSQATGKTHSTSDVDIGVLGKKLLDYKERYELQIQFALVFERPDIEVVDLRAVSPLLLKRVADQGIVLYAEHPSRFSELRVRAFKRYVETKRLRELQSAFVDRFLETHAR